MAYTPTQWESSVTALSQRNMNHIEQGIKDAHDMLEPTALAAALIDIIYPVGWLIETTDSTFNPNTALGGEWELLGEGQVIISAGANYTAGQQYGASTKSITPAGSVGSHVLTTNEIPAHTHGKETLTGAINMRQAAGPTPFATASGIVTRDVGSDTWTNVALHSSSNRSYKYSIDASHTHNSVGGGKGHNHTFTGTAFNVDVKQDSTAAYIWHRTA